MGYMQLTPSQLDLVNHSLQGKVFLEGPAGCGKTTVGVERMLYLMQQGVRGDAILLIVPQRTLAKPYYDALSVPGVTAGGLVNVVTVGGLAQRMVELFWPLAAEPAGFARPDDPPTFLTLETAQYFMARLVKPLFDEGYFESVTITHNRIYSQVLDNLNKAALVGFPLQEIGDRLKSAWSGESSQRRIYEDAQDCALRFRQYCLEHNLLDFSLQMEVFYHHLWHAHACRRYLLETFHHLIYDNVEEDTPIAHDLVREWLPEFASALLIFDTDAGYRRFLGADTQTGCALRELCSEQVVFDETLVMSEGVGGFEEMVSTALTPSSSSYGARGTPPPHLGEVSRVEVKNSLEISSVRFFPQMLDWVAEQINRLVLDEQVPPGEIAVLAPFLPDALRFSLIDRLENRGIPTRSHRPSRALREEPVTQCLLTLACLANPQWGLRPTKFDVAYSLVRAIEGLDLVRAQLLSEIVYRPSRAALSLGSFSQIKPEMQERITYTFGQRYEQLRIWVQDLQSAPQEEFDHFLSRLFGEVLSQPGFGFHNDWNAGEITANLIESARKFRWALSAAGESADYRAHNKPLGQEYLELVRDGVVAAQYLRSWEAADTNAVFLTPAYTFLMYNRPVDVQFWLDIGSHAWFERLNQPLTQPYVLSRSWPEQRIWSDADEYSASQVGLIRLVLGLSRRCRHKIFLCYSQLGEGGYEQQGDLLRLIQRVFLNLDYY